MADASAVLDSLHGIAARMDSGMSEKDVENAFLNEDFYTNLGYAGAGHDLRSEWSLPDNRRPDYVTLDANEAITAVYEFKTTGRDLAPHQDQLFHYMDELKARYGVLTNGQELRLYRRVGHERYLTVSLAETTEAQARDLASALGKPDWDVTSPDHVGEYLDELEPVELDSELGQEHFFDTFRLEEDSPFANLVTGLMDLLHELRDEREAKFVKGAYDFWEASYAAEPDDVPDSWEAFVDGSESLRDFMFCLESGHALLARLLLAKATEDHDFFPHSRGLRRYFDELGGFGGEISLDAYPVAADGMIDDMRAELVESLFEDDIFIWWTDGYAEQTASQHDNPYNRFRDVAKEGSDVTRVSPATRERFSRAIAHVVFAVLKFDFSAVEGDPLGDLYQRYFDPETRKALGEFYTPQPVIEYIMDGVGYDVGVSSERLIDPACGSGTFLVEAVERYLEDVRRYHDDPDWAHHLRELCTRPRIVGLDIHPFAVLMAQIRFMVAILPAYREAKLADDSFTIRRLPIFRTDSLRNERELTGIDLGDEDATQMTLDAITEDNQDVRIPVPLPIEVDEDEVDDTEREGPFLRKFVRMPLFDTIRLETGVENFGEYYAALQGVLDVVKYHMSEELYEYRGGLAEGIGRYTTREYVGIEEFFAPYVDDVLETVQYLQEEHGDGRLFKMFEDTVLSLVVKNYMEYEYVVGNPPYVRKEHIPAEQKSLFEQLYPESYSGNADLSIYFLNRGIEFLKTGGKIGFITSIKFTRTAYGEGIRDLVKSETIIKEFSNFEMCNYFEDATAYPCVIILERNEPLSDYDIDVVYAKEKPSQDQIPTVMNAIRELIGTPERYDDKYFTTYKTAVSDLQNREWSFTPKESNEVFRKLGKLADFELSDVVDEISAGIKTGKNSVFILENDRAESLGIEEELLKPIYRGSEIERYRVDEPTESVIYTQGIDIDEYPAAKAYLEQFKDDLANRQDATFKNRDRDWYELNIPHTPEEMEADKIICREISKRSNFAIDEAGRYVLNKIYFFRPEDDYFDEMQHLLGLLNSKVLEFYVKMTSTPVQSGYYQFFTRYLEPLPIRFQDDERISDTVDQIRAAIRLRNRVEAFPQRYVSEIQGEIEYIDYEWQTRRYPVEADIQELSDGRFAVTAGRSDEITDPRMDRGDRDSRELRARYVHAVVDGRDVKKGEQQSIPIPRRDEDVQALLDELEADRQTVRDTDIEALEAEIDKEVYDLFELTGDERQVIEDYLEVF